MRLSRRTVMVGSAATLIAAPRIVRAQTLERIRITGVPTDDMTPVFWALKNGLYEKAGLDVEVMPSGGGDASTQAVIAGANELGKGSPIASIVAYVKGIPLVTVANGVVWNSKFPYALVVTAGDSPIKTAADCNEKTAAVSALNDIAALAIMQWVDQNGGDSRTMKFVEMPNSVRGLAVAQHRVDMAGVNEPQLSAALTDLKVRPVCDAYSSIGPRWAAALYFARPDWAAQHADALKRWTRVTYSAAAYTNAHRPQTVSLMSDLTKIPLPVLAKMTRTECATASDPSLLQPVIELAVRYKAIPRAFPAKEMYFNG